MAVVQSPSEGPLFSSWDTLDKIFEQAFAPRLISSPLPTIASIPKRPSNPTPASRPVPVPKANAASTSTNPYAIFHPVGSAGPAQYASSGDSPLFSSPEPEKDATFEKLWSDASRQVNRSTTTSAPRKETPHPKKKRSRLNFRESSDSKTITATFDLPGILKEDVHVSYQPDRLVVTWEYVKVTEKNEGDKIVRERKEKKYIRTLSLPEGVQFDDVKATMDGRRLTVTYPKQSHMQAVPISKTSA